MIENFAIYFRDKLFLITGASSGIGKCAALELNKLGSKIIAISRNEKNLKLLVEESLNKNLILVENKDLSQSNNLDKWIIELSKKYGKIDGVVLSAGIQQIAPIQSVLSIENAKKLFEINYFSNMQIIKGFANKLVNNAKNARSSIVLISSSAAFKANAGISQYSASKAALNAAMKSLALELATKNIRINAIAPGFLKTSMTENFSDIYDENYLNKLDSIYPFGIGTPKDIVGAICFLLSPLSSYITGQIIVIDGGGNL